MKNIKSFKEFFLLEGKNDIKTKWLPDTNFHNLLTKNDDNLLNRLINLDPTSILESDKIGKYVSWLIILYRRGDATLKQVLSYDNMEDDYKILDALKFFDKNKNLFDKKDINQYKTLDELFTKIKSFDEMSSNITQQTDKYKYYLDLNKSGKITVFYENNNFLIIIPNDEEISCDIAGTKTSWCTARPTRSMFKSYNDSGKLYIFLDKKKNLYPTYQLHIEKNEFQDSNSKNIKAVDFFENNLDIFNKLFPNLVDKLNKKETLNKKEREWLPQSLLNSYKESFLGVDDSLYSIFNKINNGDLSMDEVITKELLGFPFEYELEFSDYKKEFFINGKNVIHDLEDAFDIENGVLGYIDTWGSNHYHYNYGGGNFDSGDFDYMHQYLNDETIERLNYLKNLLQYKKSIEDEGELYTFLSAYKLDKILETYEVMYDNMKDEAKHEAAKSILDTWCFNIDNNYITFKVDDIVTLLEKNIETEKTTLFEALEESGILDLSYEWEYNTYENEDTTELNSEMLSSIEEVIDGIEDGDSDYSMSKYISIIYNKLSSIGFVINKDNNQFYENDKISLEIKSLKLSDDYDEDEDTEEDIINECKLEIVYIDKTTEKKLKGYIKFKNISKYLQPMLF